ncbi:hypothetical protein R50076_34120 [Gilvimarinus japonicus]
MSYLAGLARLFYLDYRHLLSTLSVKALLVIQFSSCEQMKSFRVLLNAILIFGEEEHDKIRITHLE